MKVIETKEKEVLREIESPIPWKNLIITANAINSVGLLLLIKSRDPSAILAVNTNKRLDN